MEEKFYTVNEIADILKVKPLTIYRLIKAGKIHTINVGRAVRISDSEFKRFTEQGHNTTSQKAI